MKKNFDTWNSQKKFIHFDHARKYYHEREVWWCAFGMNIGFEHDGDDVYFRRPILIVKALSANTCIAIPLTSSINKHHMRISIGIVNNKEASAVISQIRVIDTKRLLARICILGKRNI